VSNLARYPFSDVTEERRKLQWRSARCVGGAALRGEDLHRGKPESSEFNFKIKG